MDYILNMITTLCVAGTLCGIVAIAHPKYKNRWIWAIIGLSMLYFIVSCFKTHTTECPFDCRLIDSLKTNINIKKEQQTNQLKYLELKAKNLHNADSIFNYNEQVRTIRYDKIAIYEMMDISLRDLSNKCDGCKASKHTYDSLLNKFNIVNEK